MLHYGNVGFLDFVATVICLVFYVCACRIFSSDCDSFWRLISCKREVITRVEIGHGTYTTSEVMSRLELLVNNCC